MAHLLLVEDDTELAELTADLLTGSGYQVTVDDGTNALEHIRDRCPDLLLLDVELPHISGFAICKEAREQGYAGPILFLTARTTNFDELLSFEMGGDDFIRKPVDPRILVKRVEAALRVREPTDSWTAGGLRIDPTNRVAFQGGSPIPLTSGQFDLLWLFARNAGSVVTREVYYREIRGIAYDGQDRGYDSRVRELRVLLQQAGCAHRIVTVRGEGYQLTQA